MAAIRRLHSLPFMPDRHDQGPQFAQLLVACDRDLRRYISVFLNRENDVEEVLQQTVTVLWEQFESYDQTRAFLPWAMRFAYFEVLNFRKSRARSKLVFSEETMEQLEATHDSMDAELEARRKQLQECIETLTNRDRQLLDCRYGGSSTIQELAKTMGQTAKSLYRRLDRIREILTRCVDKHQMTQDGLNN